MYRAVSVHLRDGRNIRGIAKNESAFDLQLLGVDGKLHLLQKSDVAEIVREKSLMPKTDASPAEMRDLVAYLSGLHFDGNAPLTGAETRLGVSFAVVAHPEPGTWPGSLCHTIFFLPAFASLLRFFMMLSMGCVVPISRR